MIARWRSPAAGSCDHKLTLARALSFHHDFLRTWAQCVVECLLHAMMLATVPMAAMSVALE
jgi:hypothetical protein